MKCGCGGSKKMVPGPSSEVRGADIVLVGNPNTGKSCLFNQLTGMDVIISNYPGTTVDILEGKSTISGRVVSVADLPGIYGLGSAAAEEKVASEYIIDKKPGLVVNVVDATLLERNLYLTLQLLELRVPMVVALNFYEELEDEGMTLDYKALSVALGVPVVPIDALRGAGIPELVKTIESVSGSAVALDHYQISYDDHIENAIRDISGLIGGTDIPKRAAVLHLLEENEPQWNKPGFDKQKARDIILKYSREHPLNTEIARERHGQAALISQKVVIPGKPKKHFREFLDRFTTEPFTGGFFLVVVLSLMLYSLFTWGGALSEFLGELFQKGVMSPLDPWIKALPGKLFQAGIVWGLDGINAGLQIAIPYVFIFYLFIGILEDTGYFPRIAYLLDRLMHRFHLHGQAVIPMMLGFGCSVPAVMATRILPNKKDRILISILICMIPCSARTAVILGAAGHYMGAHYALLIYSIVLLLIVIAGYILGKKIPGESVGLIMEMPEYRMPRIGNVLKKTWIRVNDFIWIAFPLIVLGSVVLGLLKESGALELMIKPFSPVISGWLMLPAVTGITLVYGILRKEMALVLLFVLGGSSDLLSFMTPHQIFVFTLVVALYIPCIGTFAVLKKEFGWRTSLVISLSTIVLAVAVGGIAGRILWGLGLP